MRKSLKNYFLERFFVKNCNLKPEIKMSEKPKCIVLLSTQRSGTNLLRGLLVSTKLFTDFREVFEEKRTSAESNFFNYRRKVFSENLDSSYPSHENLISLFEGYLEFLSQRVDTKYFIIDVKYNSCCHFVPFWHSPLQQPLFIGFVKKYQIPVIHLIRQNVLEAECSSILYKKNGIATLKDGQIMKHKTIFLDCNKIVKNLNFRLNEIATFKEYFKYYKWFCNIYYSDILKEDVLSDNVRHNISQIIGNEVGTSEPTPYKKMSPPLEQVIENYDEVKIVLKKNNLDYLLP